MIKSAAGYRPLTYSSPEAVQTTGTIAEPAQRSGRSAGRGCQAEIHKLYRCHDRLLVHKQAVFDHLMGRWRDLFNISYDGLLYALTSTYFEADPPFPEGDKRRFGYSRDHRPDCVQIIIALVVTPEGLPLAYEVLPGNTADKTTLRGFLERIERQYGKARRIWLMDLADGPRRADRGGARRDARCRPPGALPGGHPEGPPDALGETSHRPAVATGATRRAGQAVGARRRALRPGAKPRSRRQRASDSATPAQAVVGAAQATVDDAADA